MSATDRTVSAYAEPQQSRTSALWADKARLRRILMYWGVGIFLAIAGAVYLYGGRYVMQEDSYVHANKLMVSTDVSGLVSSVNVREGQQVKAGEILFAIDPKPWEKAIADREGKTEYRTLYARANLLLLAGRTKEARELFEKIVRTAPKGEERYAAEGLAKAIKAEHGMIGPANAWIASIRPKE